MRVIEKLTVSCAVLAQLPAAMLAICILVVACFTAAAQSGTTATTGPSGPTIVLIGGAKQGYPRTEHDYPDGILAIERLIKGSPQFQALHPVVKSFPTGFPSDLSEIADADVVLMYFGMNYGGGERHAGTMGHALDDESRRKAMEQLMSKGVGLIALHQASTLPDQTSKIPMADWLGGVRFGMADRTTEIVQMQISGADKNPIANGLKSFELLDEFYPTLTFSKTDKVTPILSAKVHIQTQNNKPVFEEPSADHVIAWAAERPNGGRSFAFTGGHYLLTFDQSQIRDMLLNAILWTSKRDVPLAGATTNAPTMPHGGGRASATPRRLLLTRADALVQSQPWGKLEWLASRELGNSLFMTVGIATINPGKENPVHSHPNCDEILHVVQGHIMNRVGDKEYEMSAGDTVTIPEGTLHNARNIGKEDAVLSISYNSADRIAIGEK
ncbi:ThuA domain-containing protein [Edaphobacter albus]|uniref:ThuA domain-containing protein n=1 Tax=Edaphobacter sp. 4G125 TaxID=2763071 RepID=UPI00164613FE|nr:ThuA domain-containing protein [Edaphobacter sp. 4G125]QNI35628.1 ThuA domain-containing protein [Edaphobacter sp. 4G125]